MNNVDLFGLNGFKCIFFFNINVYVNYVLYFFF